MAFFNSAVTVLQTLVIALGAGLGIWGAINLLEGYGNYMAFFNSAVTVLQTLVIAHWRRSRHLGCNQPA